MPPEALMAKFETHSISSKLHTLETWGKKQSPPKSPYNPLVDTWVDYSATPDPGGQIWSQQYIF